MRMQNAAQVAIGYERRQASLDRALDLSSAFPQLGFNEWQTERRVDSSSLRAASNFARVPESNTIQNEAFAIRACAQSFDMLW